MLFIISGLCLLIAAILLASSQSWIPANIDKKTVRATLMGVSVTCFTVVFMLIIAMIRRANYDPNADNTDVVITIVVLFVLAILALILYKFITPDHSTDPVEKAETIVDLANPNSSGFKAGVDASRLASLSVRELAIRDYLVAFHAALQSQKLIEDFKELSPLELKMKKAQINASIADAENLIAAFKAASKEGKRLTHSEIIDTLFIGGKFGEQVMEVMNKKDLNELDLDRIAREFQIELDARLQLDKIKQKRINQAAKGIT
jgi:cellobiose-specific phosphotransferase system component IIC